jgi:iron complex transport system substrate-binding protein
MRIVSLIASATEIICALGAERDLVGRSHECDWPPSVLDLPHLTAAKFHGAKTSLAIDTAVKALIENGLAVYHVDADQLERLKPDVIVTQDQCEVCAVSLADVEAAVCQWTASPAKVISLKPHTLADVTRDIAAVGAAIGRDKEAAALTASMQSRLDAISEAVADRPRPRVAFIEWIEPLMSCGHWMPELTTIAGGISVFGNAGETSPWISHAELTAADPDVIIIAPCGYDIAASQAEYGTLAARADWRALRAVRDGRTFIADGNAYFNRPGPRLVETAEILAAILHAVPAYAHHAGAGFTRIAAA